MSFVSLFLSCFSEETHTESLSIDCFIFLIPLSVLLVFDLLIFAFPLVEAWSLLKLMHVYKLAHCRTLYSHWRNFFNFDFMLLCPVPKTSGLRVICSFDFYRQGLPILSLKSLAVTFRFGIIPPILTLSLGPYRALYSSISHTFLLISLSGANKTSITTPVTMTGLVSC